MNRYYKKIKCNKTLDLTLQRHLCTHKLASTLKALQSTLNAESINEDAEKRPEWFYISESKEKDPFKGPATLSVWSQRDTWVMEKNFPKLKISNWGSTHLELFYTNRPCPLWILHSISNCFMLCEYTSSMCCVCKKIMFS